MTEDETLTLLKRITEDIAVIRRYTMFLAKDAISITLNKIASTLERQQMWRLCDGMKSTEQIASEIGVSMRSVQYFVQDADNENLIIMEKRGYPKRVFDMIPSEWKPWKSQKAQGGKQSQPQEEITEEKPDVES